MTHNPYAPPSSTVTDIDAGVPIPRPPLVQLAYVLCWLSLVAGVPSIVDTFMDGGPVTETAAFKVGMSVFYVALMMFAIWVIVSIGRARNWARIVYAVLTALSLLSMFGSLSELLARPWYAWSSSLLSTAMDVVIVVLLFLPAANAWYRVRGRGPPQSAA
jgi:hypothetical protein